MEFKKLVQSSCINLVSNEYSSLYQKVIPADILQQIWKICGQNKSEYEDCCPEETKQIITEIFDALKRYQFDEKILGVLAFLDTERAKTTNKESEKYKIICVITSLVKCFQKYKNEQALSEATHVRVFSQVVDELLMNNTIITFSDGETVSRSTRRMKILTENDSDYDRRIDLIVKSKEDDEQFEHQAGVSTDVLTHQQSKNLRINACISNEINLLLGNTDTRINYFDFSGRQAYVSHLFHFDGCSVAFKVGTFTIPKNFVGLDRLRSSLITLYS